MKILHHLIADNSDHGRAAPGSSAMRLHSLKRLLEIIRTVVEPDRIIIAGRVHP
jgi:hypothetical protein